MYIIFDVLHYVSVLAHASVRSAGRFVLVARWQVLYFQEVLAS